MLDCEDTVVDEKTRRIESLELLTLRLVEQLAVVAGTVYAAIAFAAVRVSGYNFGWAFVAATAAYLLGNHTMSGQFKKLLGFRP